MLRLQVSISILKVSCISCTPFPAPFCLQLWHILVSPSRCVLPAGQNFHFLNLLHLLHHSFCTPCACRLWHILVPLSRHELKPSSCDMFLPWSLLSAACKQDCLPRMHPFPNICTPAFRTAFVSWIAPPQMAFLLATNYISCTAPARHILPPVTRSPVNMEKKKKNRPGKEVNVLKLLLYGTHCLLPHHA